uniref:PlsC domain-containing protein n=1 Tax=Heligmosomoides polygyrus TaxID=6339 RepID=A0A8L8KI71_HELPZ
LTVGVSVGIIQRETQICLDDVDRSEIDEVRVESRGWAAIRDSLDFMKAGIESIIEDDVTSRFEAEQLVSWNMLTRTSTRFYHYVNWKLSLVWVMGFMFRYCLMLPFRVVLVSIGLFLLVVSTAAIGVIPEGDLRSKLNCMCMIMCCRILSRGLTAVVKFHDVHNRARNGGICVANHTSPIDVMLLSIDNVYALVGQRHSGLLGLIQHALSRASSHIWFERSETRDRRQVTMILRDHCGDTRKLPILIFPEGTCINNTSVMMFKKGSFEVGAPIYPIAMKYDSRFGDPFWNSSAQSWCEYVIRMMTSWAIICNIYYLPPMEKLPNEDAMAFASRVKKAIAARGGFVDLEWDGALKRSRVPSLLVAKQQSKYANRLSRYTSTSNTLDSELDGYIGGFFQHLLSSQSVRKIYSQVTVGVISITIHTIPFLEFPSWPNDLHNLP